MTPSEFKAWFDGFTEAFEGRIPTKAQWGRIKDRVAEIDGKPVTERIYLDRYWPTYNPPIYWSLATSPVRTFTTYCGATGGASGAATGGTITLAQNAVQSGHAGVACFNSTVAMADLGRAEAKSLAA